MQAWRKVMAAYHQIYDSRHLQADCQGPGYTFIKFRKDRSNHCGDITIFVVFKTAAAILDFQKL